jgi:hypothetical protein
MKIILQSRILSWYGMNQVRPGTLLIAVISAFSQLASYPETIDGSDRKSNIVVNNILPYKELC